MYRLICEKASVRLRLFLCVLMGLCLSACTTTSPAPTTYPKSPGQITTPNTQTPAPDKPDTKVEVKDPEPVSIKPDDTAQTKDGLTPPFMNRKTIKRVAIILPFSDPSSTLRKEAQGLLNAAQLSVFARDDDDVLLIAIDNQGTDSGSKNAVKQAVAQGADVILGPIKSKSVRAAGKEAAKNNIPVIGFSNDVSVAGKGVYLLSFPPEAEAKRIVEFATAQGATKFAFLGPNSTYGNRVQAAYRDQISAMGGTLTASESYTGSDITAMQGPAERLAKLYITAQKTGVNDPAYHAVLMPEGGIALRSLAPLLPYFSDELRDVQFMGTGRWNDADVIKEPALNGGIFAGPEISEKQKFEANFDANFAQDVGSLTSLGYDGLTIAAFVAGADERERYEALEDPSGFYGVDGYVRFNKSGAPIRGLAVFQIRNGRLIEIDAAPEISTTSS